MKLGIYINTMYKGLFMKTILNIILLCGRMFNKIRFIGISLKTRQGGMK